MQQFKSLFGEYEPPKYPQNPNEDQINEALHYKSFASEFKHLRRTIMILNNYIDNHLTDYEQPLTKREIDELKALNAEREMTDTFAHKMIRKLLPKHIKCLDSMKPQ
jgi:hypothetical protein